MSALQCPWWTAAKQLPWSADGVPMLPNDEVWYVDPWDGMILRDTVGELRRDLTYRPFPIMDHTGDPDFSTRDVPMAKWYSTREALEAALAKEGS